MRNALQRWGGPLQAYNDGVDETLANGLRLLVQEVRTVPLVSVWCWYRVGSKDEGPGLTGASHWVEHMNFKGTKRIARDEIKNSIERYGGFWNGYTWIDQTTYVQTATRDALDQMLFVESERMHHCLYEPADCDSERTVIISELQGGENDPDTLLDIELTATAFKAHPYRHPTIGWQADLEAMTRDDLYGFYRRYYVPNNATLVIVGDVDAGRRGAAGRGRLRRHPRRGGAPAAAGHRAAAARRAPADDPQGRGPPRTSRWGTTRRPSPTTTSPRCSSSTRP